MQILVNTDTNIEGSADFVEQTEGHVADVLARFDRRLTRVEVHFRNESAGRTTGEDVGCMIEARPAGMDPVAVTEHAASIAEALHGATGKLEALLSSTFDRQGSQSSRDTIRGH